jgi:hypothetical protein
MAEHDEESPKKIGENRRLTRAEQNLLAVLVNPAFNQPDTTNEQRFNAAKISESRFYGIMTDPWFKEQHKNAVFQMIRSNVGSIINASVKTAQQEGRNGFMDRRMLMEMSGMYVPKQAFDHTTGGKPIKSFADISDGDDAGK